MFQVSSAYGGGLGMDDLGILVRERAYGGGLGMDDLGILVRERAQMKH